MSNKKIAKRLGKDPSTIGREIARNSYKGKVYVAIHAQQKAEESKVAARKRHPLKNKDVYQYVLKHLRMGWSPEQIAGRLKHVEHPDDSCWHISHEPIYQFIYSKENKQKKRKVRSGRKVHRSRISDRVSIPDFDTF